ncbi:MAG: hypothetical protein ACPGQM_00065 [Alphaproteobacteria bacterium]
MHAQKFQILYSPVQDRVLIIVTGEDAQERVFGLTLRIVKRLVPGLRSIMGNDAFANLTPDMPFDSPKPKPTAESNAADPTQTAGPDGPAPGNMTTTADDEIEPAANAEPAPPRPQPDIHLLNRLRIVAKAKGAHVLQISDTAATPNVPLNSDQITQFTQGILTVLERAEWALDWNEETAEPQAASTPAGATADAIDITANSPSRYRH